jgi:hypothetical protein
MPSRAERPAASRGAVPEQEALQTPLSSEGGGPRQRPRGSDVPVIERRTYSEDGGVRRVPPGDVAAMGPDKSEPPRGRVDESDNARVAVAIQSVPLKKRRIG